MAKESRGKTAKNARTFRTRYGPWAVIAGASEGLGAAFGRSTAARSCNLVVAARREEPLKALASELRANYGVEVRPLPLDCSEPGAIEQIDEATRNLDVGLLIYNAAFSNIGLFLEREKADHERLIRTNCLGPARFAHYFGRRMRSRERSGIILMSSMSGFQGSPWVAHYAASKAYNMVLAQGLWYELRQDGIDVVASCPGPTDTPGWRDNLGGKAVKSFPPVADPEKVAEETLNGLGKKVIVIPGGINKVASFLMRKLMPLRTAIRTIAKSTGGMYAGRD